MKEIVDFGKSQDIPLETAGPVTPPSTINEQHDATSTSPVHSHPLPSLTTTPDVFHTHSVDSQSHPEVKNLAAEKPANIPPLQELLKSLSRHSVQHFLNPTQQQLAKESTSFRGSKAKSRVLKGQNSSDSTRWNYVDTPPSARENFAASSNSIKFPELCFGQFTHGKVKIQVFPSTQDNTPLTTPAKPAITLPSATGRTLMDTVMANPKSLGDTLATQTTQPVPTAQHSTTLPLPPSTPPPVSEPSRNSVATNQEPAPMIYKAPIAIQTYIRGRDVWNGTILRPLLPRSNII
ncbi:hypothetical protein CPB83DRAFT_900137 [Crepidotus variabilis]|uniref:Uncharacterized protein n=1 Tax=Crepidotus variabilis TaxID=179855 RepID=A0A9P6E3N8_9AGAR|nr:hypothetical protein CPB83DRAFT_900137 [Crepidotus variabilis]